MIRSLTFSVKKCYNIVEICYENKYVVKNKDFKHFVLKNHGLFIAHESFLNIVG